MSVCGCKAVKRYRNAKKNRIESTKRNLWPGKMFLCSCPTIIISSIMMVVVAYYFINDCMWASRRGTRLLIAWIYILRTPYIESESEFEDTYPQLVDLELSEYYMNHTIHITYIITASIMMVLYYEMGVYTIWQYSMKLTYIDKLYIEISRAGSRELKGINFM